ncbi:hypothetical protein ARMA_1327 [Ardenticatena maritima]|uniref:Sulfotransferase domain-containing protein n=2 Tax=Ardenticatena maritima TaxID=872965 RepID=A0A0M9UCG2_9CHLR|nr:sulfotransferase [Ardenticatena maritima]GAP62904.1 hypothetical protein ARMA_1327 [Ardenticatena maritima]
MSTNNQRVLWLIGSGRSGTTWLQRVLATLLDGEICFEPLHPEYVNLPNLHPPIKHSNSRPYLRATQHAPSWATFVQIIQTGKVHSPWLDVGYTTSRWRWKWHRLQQMIRSPFQARIIKSIRATLLLGWLKSHFDVPIIFLIRHPCAVVSSQARLGWFMNAQEFLEDSLLVEDYLQPYVNQIAHLQGAWAHRAAFWAIENLVGMQLAQQFDIPIVFYEHLVCSPQETLQSLLHQLGYTWHEHRWRHVQHRLLRPASPKHLAAWRNTLDPQTIQTILEVVHTLGVSVYDEDPLPSPRMLH